MEKLTKQQFRDRFADIKVYVDGKSKELQEQFFKAEIWWIDGAKTVQITESPFLYVDRHNPNNNLEISHGTDMENFKRVINRQVTAEEILNIEIVEDKPECPFKPFDKVLVRYRGESWKVSFFSHQKYGIFHCVDNKYAYCLPYNEKTAHLLGTTNDYKEDEQ